MAASLWTLAGAGLKLVQLARNAGPGNAKSELLVSLIAVESPTVMEARLPVTSNGHLTLIPSETQAGDLVCIFLFL